MRDLSRTLPGLNDRPPIILHNLARGWGRGARQRKARVRSGHVAREHGIRYASTTNDRAKGKTNVDRLRVRAHLRSDSGPELTRFALDFAPHAGGDLLWLAYVPDGLRAWFRRFADSCDPTKGVHHPFRVARLFDSPSLSEIEFLVGRIRSRGQTAGRSG